METGARQPGSIVRCGRWRNGLTVRFYVETLTPHHQPIDVGCEIETFASPPPELFASASDYLIDSTYQGQLPYDGRDHNFATWADERGSKLRRARGEYIAMLRFGSGDINIGEIATGRVKNVVDCLWPLIGGQPGAPQDWRIRTLQVEKAFPGLGVDEIRVQVSATH
jgi:hypothetical protein